MQKIVPHLWFDKEGKEAAQFYGTVFPESGLRGSTILRNTPGGDAEFVVFDVWGQTFMAISSGPLFKVNPSISFMVNVDPARDPDARIRIDEIWAKLAEGGKVLMPLEKYPFSERYGWVEDKYGVSWQLILTNPEGEPRPRIVPSFMFTGPVYGKAEEATDFYLSVFKESKRGALVHYGPGAEPEREGTVMFTDFMLEGQWFAAMESGYSHDFNFSEGVSLLINCDTQQEIDYYFEKLSAVPEAAQCGWLKDKYGVSWQVSPSVMNRMMTEGTPEQVDRVVQAMLPMKKLDIAVLEAAYSVQ